ncbi:MAG: DUF4861 domain-containing protein [Dysgonamonadaceae bacterium]|jgi:hypothetical protein|nr:DUF4861 domain-containing protein [Dysgonamonadaceae bacterium]
MKNALLIVIFALFPVVSGAQNKSIQLVLENKTNQQVNDYVVEIPASILKKLTIGEYIAQSGNEIVPIEIVTDLKGNLKGIFPVASFKPHEIKKVEIKQGTTPQYPKRTYAELSHRIGGNPKDFRYDKKDTVYTWVKPNYMKLPGSFRDHALYIKYEGPGWESDMAAFRFYLDQRNAIDVFGKKTPGIILPQVGIDGYENYHKSAVSHWGVDNMTVGNSLGIGSIAYWDGQKAIRVENRDSVECFVQADGKIRSQIMTTYFGWNIDDTKYNLKSLISIDAGSRTSHMELQVDKNIPNLATGFIKKKDTELLVNNDENSIWSYIATWGKQSNEDIKKYQQESNMMGLAIFVRTKQIKEITSDKLNHVIVLEPENGYVEYYFMPVWEFDWQPVATKTDFQHRIDEVLTRLNNPINIK